MRKFPIYNLAQEITMQMMMVLMIVGYMAFDQLTLLGSYSYAIFGFCIWGITFLFIRQIKNMTVVRVINQSTQSKFEVVKSNWSLILLSNVIIIALSLVHFYIWIEQGKDLSPLYKEYGIGALLGVFLFIYNSRNFSLTTTEKGIAFGGKFDMKLLLWEDIKSVSMVENNLIVVPKNTIGFNSLKIPPAAVSRELENLLRMENVPRIT